jgi:hypothetical protein
MLHKFVATDGTEIQVHVHERRRYSSSMTYTWLYALVKDKVVEGVLDSAFPCIMPGRSDCLFALRSAGYDIPVEKRDIAWLNRMWRKCLAMECSPEDAASFVTPQSRAVRDEALKQFKLTSATKAS